MKKYRLGIDVGGTFTDLVLYNMEHGTISVKKVPTTPSDPSVGIFNGIDQLGIDLSEVDGLTHGTTVATNTLIKRSGAKTAFLTTEGFRDTLEIRRANREELYDAQWTPPAPLVRRRNRLEIRERMLWDGEVALALDENQVEDVIETLRVRDIEAVAICFLHSYEHDAHEKRVKEMIEAALPGTFVSTSTSISQEFREFERGSTVVANAYVGPGVANYLKQFEANSAEQGLESGILVMQSNGGVCTISEAISTPVKLARSGPAGAAMGLEQLARLTGEKNLVGIDIGGTSADVSVIIDGVARWTSPLTVEWGMPLLIPSIDVVSIGAGGGSIGSIDAAGALQMGPDSAGANPGPACYGIGGSQPTTTDAHVVLGRIDGNRPLGGLDRLDEELARSVIDEQVAGPLGISVVEAAEGMIRILNTAMLQAIRLVTIEKGYDPRDFTLVGLGGGGPVHVAELAHELGIKRAIVPNYPGVFSAWGMLSVNIIQDRSRTILRRRKAVDNKSLMEVFAGLRQSIASSLLGHGVDVDEIEYSYFLDMQYYGQSFALAVNVGKAGGAATEDGSASDQSHRFRASEEGILSVRVDIEKEALELSEEAVGEAEERFHIEHEREYGHADRNQEVQLVHARVFGTVAVAAPENRVAAQSERFELDVASNREAVRDIHFGGVAQAVSVINRDALAPGAELVGPVVIRETSSETVVPPSMSLHVDSYGNLIINTWTTHDSKGVAGP